MRSLSSSMVAATRMHFRSLFVLLALAQVAGCSDSHGPPAPTATTLVIQTGNNQSALAGTALPAPVIVAVRDQSGQPIAGETATFTVTAGGGFLSNSTGQRNGDGTFTAPTWTLGKSNVPQQMQATVDGKTSVVDASVETAYTIIVRFFGRTLSTAQQALFTAAAARVTAIIVGRLPLVDVSGADVSDCTGTTIPPLTGSIAGLVIYASLDSIDGPQKVLARAGPCFVRTDQNNEPDYRTVIGVMQFDSADVASLATSGALQETITHEMLHVVGFGSFWPVKNLIINSGTPAAAYSGPGGIAGCQAVGGIVTCASSVPIENCGADAPPNCGPGSLESHWRESTFRTELMTGFISSGGEPLSVMTIRSLEDLNYTVNTAAGDPYTIAIGSLMAAATAPSSATASGPWERPLPVRPRMLPTIRF